jgi:hypoxanthine-DNA glycosylase
LNSFKKSFLPISNPNIEILILGSMPSDKSLLEQEYYAHPQNRFWKVLASITHCSNPTNYLEKLKILEINKIGLWDVVCQAKRVGSLDSAIEDETPNDIETFIHDHPQLKVICFNGKKSEALFNKYFEQKPFILYLSLPSTSPANATIRFEDVCEKWKDIFLQS